MFDSVIARDQVSGNLITCLQIFQSSQPFNSIKSILSPFFKVTESSSVPKLLKEKNTMLFLNRLKVLLHKKKHLKILGNGERKQNENIMV